MSSSLRRGTLAATALALAAASLSACAAGNDAQSLEVKPDSAATAVDDIKVQAVNIVTTTGEPRAAGVAARIFNNGAKDQTLKAITVKGAHTSAKLSPAKGEKKLTVPAGGSLALGGKDNASALLTGKAADAVRDGDVHRVTFDLSRTGKITLKAMVVPAKGDFANAGPSVQPSAGAGASGSPSQQPSGSPSESPSGKPSGAASASASASASTATR